MTAVDNVTLIVNVGPKLPKAFDIISTKHPKRARSALAFGAHWVIILENTNPVLCSCDVQRVSKALVSLM
jgi:hypothetical protein